MLLRPQFEFLSPARLSLVWSLVHFTLKFRYVAGLDTSPTHLAQVWLFVPGARLGLL